MPQHKAWCSCRHCDEARALKKRLNGNRKVPGFVMEQYKQKMLAEEQKMLDLGYILMSCPHCQHTSFSKIQPVMKCGACCKPLA